jgi:hypothetical protein
MDETEVRMMGSKVVSYLRVSGGRGQRADGLGIEAQRLAVADYCAGHDAKLVREFVEVESGKVNSRPQLAEALTLARMTGSVLVVARLCRLSRDAAFLIGLEQSGIEFVACDVPSANRLTVRLMAVLAQEEGLWWTGTLAVRCSGRSLTTSPATPGRWPPRCAAQAPASTRSPSG